VAVPDAHLRQLGEPVRGRQQGPRRRHWQRIEAEADLIIAADDYVASMQSGETADSRHEQGVMVSMVDESADHSKSLSGERLGTEPLRSMIMLHSALRRKFRLLLALVRGVPDADTGRAQIVAEHIDFLTTILHAHHHGEDVVISAWRRGASSRSSRSTPPRPSGTRSARPRGSTSTRHYGRWGWACSCTRRSRSSWGDRRDTALGRAPVTAALTS
jgi:hypothetical protein